MISLRHHLVALRASRETHSCGWLIRSGPLLALVVVGVLTGGCGGTANQDLVDRRGWQDLLVDGGLRMDSPVGGPPVEAAVPSLEPILCGDVVRQGIQLAARRDIALDVLDSSGPVVDPEAVATLRLEGCARQRSTELRLRWRDAGGQTHRWQHRVEAGGILRTTIPLDPAPARGLRLRSVGGAFDVQEMILEGRAASPPPDAVADDLAGRQILLISIDTLRADAVEPPVLPMPAFDALRVQSQRMTRHYSGAPWTKPSHGTLLTGQPVRVHGAVNVEDALRPSVTTLAERFRDAGWATEGLVHDCVWLNPKFGFDRGFERYRSVPWSAPKQVRAAAASLDALADRPFFLFLHTFDPHSDFRRLPYESLEADATKAGAALGVERYGCREAHCASGLLKALETGDIDILPGEVELLRSLYHRGVADLDATLGWLVARLRERGLWDRLTVVVTSDHGESLHGVGRMLHGSPFEEVLRVPLWIKWPAGERAGVTIDRTTSSLDVATTLLSAAGLPTSGLPGVDLRVPSRERPAFAGTHWRVVIDGDLKLWWHRIEPSRLYDLAADPGETRDLAAQRPVEVARLERLLRRWQRATRAAADTEAPSATIDAEEAAHLEALGYL
ncbi:MAG: sulfatase [Acidobacteriota bacterium]